MSGTSYAYTGSAWQPLKADATSGATFAGLWVWTGSAWTQMTQPKTSDNAEIYGYNGTNWRNIRLDESTRTLQTIEYEHHEIHGGSTYLMYRSDTLATNDVIQLYWSTPGTTEEQHVVWEFYGAGAITVELLEGVTYSSGGTAFTPVNHNRRGTPGTSNCTCKVGSNGVLSDAISYSGGTVLYSEEIGSGKSSPGDGGHAVEFIFEQSTEYLLEMTAVGNNIRCNMQAHWYEHTPKAA